MMIYSISFILYIYIYTYTHYYSIFVALPSQHSPGANGAGLRSKYINRRLCSLLYCWYSTTKVYNYYNYSDFTKYIRSRNLIQKARGYEPRSRSPGRPRGLAARCRAGDATRICVYICLSLSISLSLYIYI